MLTCSMWSRHVVRKDHLKHILCPKLVSERACTDLFFSVFWGALIWNKNSIPSAPITFKYIIKIFLFLFLTENDPKSATCGYFLKERDVAKYWQNTQAMGRCIKHSKVAPDLPLRTWHACWVTNVPRTNPPTNSAVNGSQSKTQCRLHREGNFGTKSFIMTKGTV